MIPRSVFAGPCGAAAGQHASFRIAPVGVAGTPQGRVDRDGWTYAHRARAGDPSVGAAHSRRPRPGGGGCPSGHASGLHGELPRPLRAAVRNHPRRGLAHSEVPRAARVPRHAGRKVRTARVGRGGAVAGLPLGREPPAHDRECREQPAGSRAVRGGQRRTAAGGHRPPAIRAPDRPPPHRPRRIRVRAQARGGAHRRGRARRVRACRGAAIAERPGERERAALLYRVVLEQDPTDEAAARERMRHLAALRDTNGVSKVFKALAEALRRERDDPRATPAPETRELLAELLGEEQGAVV